MESLIVVAAPDSQLAFWRLLFLSSFIDSLTWLTIPNPGASLQDRDSLFFSLPSTELETDSCSERESE